VWGIEANITKPLKRCVTVTWINLMSAIGGKADIGAHPKNVRF
jgi:hypothetical protein